VAKRLPGAWQDLARDEQRANAVSRRIRRAASAAPLDPARSAAVAGLRYVNDQQIAGFQRRGRAKRFRYVHADGTPVADEKQLRRIRSLVIPPAWTAVWICPDPNGHLQATGRDARGRKQYRYHPRWREVRDEVKYYRLAEFAEALPRVRACVSADLKRTGLPREKVLAAVVRLLEKTLIRVGNEEYARTNGAFGLTTMRDAHAKIEGARVRFEFRGKSGVRHAVEFSDRRLARIVRACRDLPGYELFQWVDAGGVRQTIDSADVNAYLRAASGADFTAKDFRTWAGTVLAATTLSSFDRCRSQAEARRNIVRAVSQVADRLGNTKAVCRKSYIHPLVFDAYGSGSLMLNVRNPGQMPNGDNLDAQERAVLAFLRSANADRSRIIAAHPLRKSPDESRRRRARGSRTERSHAVSRARARRQRGGGRSRRV
jgi:DNA topoisomerase-1